MPAIVVCGHPPPGRPRGGHRLSTDRLTPRSQPPVRPGRRTEPSVAGKGRPGRVPAMTVVEIYTDGACIPNPGPGGWGAVLRFGDAEKDLCGGEAGATTNNRMELMAPIQALDSLTRA